MRSRRYHPSLVVGALVLAVGLPTAALAGKKAVSGQQTLQIKAHLTPSRAGARHVTFGFRFDYGSTQPGQQPPYNTKAITLLLPPGLVLNPRAAPACKRSQIDRNNGDLSKCPAKTIVGNGSVTVNAAPAIIAPITGTVTTYNSVNDVGIGQPRGTRNLVLWIKTSIGITVTVPFRVLTGPRGRTELRAKFTKPKQPGVSPGSFTIEQAILSLTGSGRGSYITNPPTCMGNWPFSLTIVNYFNQPPITAHDRVSCRP